MTTEIKRLIRVRTDKGATFKRDGYGKKKQLSDSWRKPRGQHNKQREQKKAKGPLPKPGFGSPTAVRGMHPSGFFEVLLSSVKNLKGLDPKTQSVRIAGTIGNRKRAILQEQAIAAGFRVLNARTVKTEPKQEKIEEPAPAEVADKEQSKEKKPAPSKSPASPVKKEKKKAEKTPGAEEKKAPVKEKKSAKPKAEPAEKTPEKTPEKIKAAAPAKTARKTAKPKTEEPAEAKAEPKAAAKPKAKKKAESEVKKNE
jgi:large subunit ribosomal protein L32e